MVTATAIWGIEHLAGVTSPKGKMGILFGLNLVLGYLVFFVLDRGHLVSPSQGAARARAAA
jgi:hypothetical protein